MRIEDVRARFPIGKPDSSVVDCLLQAELIKNKKKIVVLDDDPTGIQTVHDVSVYTNWSMDSIREGFQEQKSLFYLLTNSRALTVAQTTKLHLELTANVIHGALESGQEVMIISRSDSTLRGHYPLETELIRQVLETKTHMVMDGEILLPFFKEGGRYTVDNIHYVEDDAGELVPAGETEFAKDKTFGYQSSNLCEYIEEKTKGRYRAKDTITISLESLRGMDIDGIVAQLLQAGDFAKIVVNAIDYIDMKVFVIALFRAMARGRNFMVRSAAGFVKVIGGITDQPLLTKKEMLHNENGNGGMVVVGSHTQKTTAQMEQLRGSEGVTFIPFNSDLVDDDAAFELEIRRVVAACEEEIRNGRTALTYTSRTLLSKEGDSKEQALLRSVRISEAVMELVKRLSVVPSFVIAKGGITSSDIGVKALRVRKANVLGQIEPGIPVWETDKKSKFPGIPYIIFPGNVGRESSLKKAVEVLTGK